MKEETPVIRLQNFVWAFYYNPMIEESSDQTMSLHWSKKNAVKAMQAHKKAAKEEWVRTYKNDRDEEPYRFGRFESWSVGQVKIEP